MIAAFLTVPSFSTAQSSGDRSFPIDATCATCSRRAGDSLNLQVGAIRLNQVGYLPGDPDKAAMVADPGAQTFSVVDAATGKSVFTGTLKPLGTFTGGAMEIRGAYNSVTDLYHLSRPAQSESLHRADFSGLQASGTYRLACAKDTSVPFRIDAKVYNQVFETSLKFFGSNRCGATHSWMHGDCHLKDGDALGAAMTGRLAGGWHDCGDHGKYGETVAYAAMTLSLTYALWPQKGEDFYGASYADTLPFGTDGIPDVLYEARIGADYILELYKASRDAGLLDKGDMYHSVGMGPGMDHTYWDVPEKQDAQPASKGGPARPVTAGIGSNVAGLFAASLAFFARGWEPFDPVYSRECLAAAKDIYARIVMARRSTPTAMPCCYPGGGPTKDDEGLAALALWYASRDTSYRFDLLDNPALGSNPTAVFNQGEFPSGILANPPFHHGGWTTDYENVHAFVLYGFAKLIAGSPADAAAYGLNTATADSLRRDCVAALYNSILIGSNGKGKPAPGINADEPYHGVFTSADWGFNRYNMGLVTELFMYWDLTGDKAYYNIGIDNLNYNLGMNPWDISFLMGAGSKNLQHPHNRAANPEGYNAGGLPYAYRSPKGALMGGCKPDQTLIDDWEKYTNTETCIDFSSQLLIPAQMLAMDVPEDTRGPRFRNVDIFPETDSALVTWTTDEFSRDTLFLLDAPGGKLLQTVPAGDLARDKRVVIRGLRPGTTYWFWLEGADVRGNATVDRNGGDLYRFTTKTSEIPAVISSVKVCNETDEAALITWWTRNGEYPSQVGYGKTQSLGSGAGPDDGGVPARFHRVTLSSLEAATRYWFQVQSGSVVDDNAGKFYSFGTTEVLVDYTIRIKPTNKAEHGASAHFYVDVANNENTAYTGLELRFYFTADAATAAALTAKGFDNQVFGVAGIPSALDIDYGAPKPVPGLSDVWYFPITLRSTLPVAGRARFELQINAGAGGWGPYPFASLRDAWSIRSHARPGDPEDFPGVDLSKGETGAYTGPEMVETVNGEKAVSYVEDPYITAYYHGVHVFGRAPDAAADPLKVTRTVTLDLATPVSGPEDRYELRGEVGKIGLSGRASIGPDGRIDEIVVNGKTLPEADLVRDSAGVAFSDSVDLAEGANVIDIIAWDTVDCAVAARNLVVNWIKGPPEPVVSQAGIRPAFLDLNADGYADALKVGLDEKDGPVDPAVVLDQAHGFRLTSGLETEDAKLDKDTLRLGVKPNKVVIRDGAESLAVPAPGQAKAAGLLPGSYPVRDAIAPVLRRAVLRRGRGGSPDSLLLVFSEAVAADGIGPEPFAAANPAGEAYGFQVGPGRAGTIDGLKDDESAVLYPILSTPGAAGGATLAPADGDPVHIVPGMGIRDAYGNTQDNPANVRVPLRIEAPLAYRVESAAPGGIASLPVPSGPAWTVYAGPGNAVLMELPPGSPPLADGPPEPPRAAGLKIESTLPFLISLTVYDNLGQYVTRTELDLRGAAFASLPAGSEAGTRQAWLLWNGRSAHGNFAATGAYIYAWKLTFIPAVGPPLTTLGKRILGVLRDR